MRLTLLPIAFFATCLTAAAAQPGTFSTPPTHKAHKVIQTAPVAKTTEAATRMKLQPGQEAIKISTGHPALQSRQMTQSTASSQPEESDDLPPYGTLLATLVLMAAIAVRRSNTGRP